MIKQELPKMANKKEDLGSSFVRVGLAFSLITLINKESIFQECYD